MLGGEALHRRIEIAGQLAARDEAGAEGEQAVDAGAANARMVSRSRRTPGAVPTLISNPRRTGGGEMLAQPARGGGSVCATPIQPSPSAAAPQRCRRSPPRMIGAGLLHRLGAEAARRHLVEAAGEARRVLAPQRPHQADRLARAGGAIGERHAGRREFVGQPADDAEQEAAVGQTSSDAAAFATDTALRSGTKTPVPSLMRSVQAAT